MEQSITPALQEKINTLQTILDNGRRIVFFGGAGVSTESGIPDFRSADGLYHQKYKYNPETILSHSFFMQKPEEFYEFYRDKMVITDVEPNITHLFLAKLEAAGKLSGVVTQNIDGLHQAGGSHKVIELHGSIHRNYCMNCKKFYPLSAMTGTEPVPHCDCGGLLKPDVVLYEESLKENDIDTALALISNADVLIVGGTSLSVYPAASFIRYFQGDHLVLINKSSTPYDNNADLLIQAGLGEVFSRLEVRE
ncbi:MAG: NAD-dependent protein deacylase [Lachnospiraceae bacterium]|nr:NAD-dependent protein deacylase [Lachnospiraceae bacterium]